MTAFEQAWALLKSINPIKDPNNAAMKNNPDYYYNSVFEEWMHSPLETRQNDDDYWHHRIQQDYGEGGEYSDMAPKPSLREIAEEVGFGPIEGQSKPTSESSYNPVTYQMQLPINDFLRNKIIDGKYRKPRQGESLRPITPLEDRVPNKPPVSHIEWNPNTGYYTLRGTKGEELSTILDGGEFSLSAIPKNPLRNYMGETPSEFRRKGYYEKLLRGLLNAGVDITSDSRNFMSNPFHRKFIDNLPPNLEVLYRRNNDNEISQLTPINYRRKQFPLTFGASDLALRDYGAVPIQSLPMNPVREPIGSYQSLLGDFQE